MSPSLAFNFCGGGGWIRTTEVLRRQIYSLLPLATRVSHHMCRQLGCNSGSSCWSWRWDLNPQPADYKSAALPIELRQRQETIYILPGQKAIDFSNFFYLIFHSRLKLSFHLFFLCFLAFLLQLSCFRPSLLPYGFYSGRLIFFPLSAGFLE